MNESKKNKLMPTKVLKNLYEIFIIWVKKSPSYFILVIFETLLGAFVVFLEHSYGIEYVLNCVEYNLSFGKVIRLIIILVILQILHMFLNSLLYNYVEPNNLSEIKKDYKMRLFKKANNIDLEYYDMPEYYNQYVLAMGEADNVVKRIIELSQKVFNGMASCVFLVFFYISKDFVSLVIVIINFIVTILASNKVNKIVYNTKIEQLPYEREKEYINRVFYLNKYAKDLKLYPYQRKKLYERYENNNNKTKEINDKYKKRKFIWQFIKDYIGRDFITDSFYIFYLVYSAAVLHSISYSSIVVLYYSQSRLKAALMQLAVSFQFAVETSIYIDQIHNFSNLETKLQVLDQVEIPEIIEQIEFCNVSFIYDNCPVLENINFSISKNEKIAFVGHNGAGKTTIIKLLLRFYDPNEGEILLNGINIKKFDIDSYRKKMAAVFQDFIVFDASIKDNIVLADEEKEQNNTGVYEALKMAGFNDIRYVSSDGIDTSLTQEFDSDAIDLSGGEKQKIALARAFYKNSEIVVLDEPSSSLDPIAEYNINQQITKYLNEKLVIYISHRLATVKNAERIYVLENGKIVGVGSHKELLRFNDYYQNMWNTQASKYLIN